MAEKSHKISQRSPFELKGGGGGTHLKLVTYFFFKLYFYMDPHFDDVKKMGEK